MDGDFAIFPRAVVGELTVFFEQIEGEGGKLGGVYDGDVISR